ncbi:MAG: ECF transporter S component [Clostridia bacterium]|nr:ECF transporter S component [Clostridia bacterium]
MHKRSERLRRLTAMAMLTALSYITVVLIRIPVVLFLSYEPKDVFLTIGGFLFGPVAGICMSIAVALVEMVTISSTGPIGMLMNCVSSCLFVGTASIIYYRKKTLKRALFGLIAAALATTIGMLLWNYLITPLYMHTPREAIADMLLPVFLPFNLLKGGLNAAFTMLLYKSAAAALRAAQLLPKTDTPVIPRKRLTVTLAALGAVITLVLLLLVWKGIM